jgi:predicted aldo/keto reductase-like oxidoreductase
MRAIGSVDQMASVLEAAAKIGINHLETAPAYGPAEQFLGEALQHCSTLPEGGWVTTSKLLPGLSLVEGQQQLDEILHRLGLNTLDNLAVHGINRKEHLEWALSGDGAQLLEWAVSSGRVMQLGFSSHGTNALIEQALRSQRFDFCSLHLHLFDPQRLPLAHWALENGIGVMAISPADKGGRLQAPSPTLKDDCQPIDPLVLAYRFLIAQGVSTLTLGAASSEDLTTAAHLAEADGPLQQEETDVLHQLEQRRRERLGQRSLRSVPCLLAMPQSGPNSKSPPTAQSDPWS